MASDRSLTTVSGAARSAAVSTDLPITLWVTPVADLGGVARHFLDVARVGIPGWRLVVLSPPGPLAQRLREQGAAVVSGDFGPAAGVLASIRTLRAIARALRPAIVHSHLAYADIVSAVTPLPRGARRFTTEHGIAADDSIYHGSALQSRIMDKVHSLRLRRFDGIIAVSEATKQAMIDKWRPRRQITVIPNGVDLPDGVEPRDPNNPPSTLRILSLARLAPEKRIDKLIDAFAIVRKERPDATLTIAGTGPLEQELRSQVVRLGLQDAVSFPGFVEAEEALNQADVVAQLSVWENCSYTLLDAAVRGIRVVASDVGGNREIVPGQLVDDWSPEHIADKLTRQAGVISAPEHNSVSVMVRRTLESYDGG